MNYSFTGAGWDFGAVWTMIGSNYPDLQTNSNAVSDVTLKVNDMPGNEIATLVNENKPAGNYEVKFDGSKLASGIYFYKLQAGNFVQTIKLILMK